MVYCRYCNSEVSETQDFCPNCGVEVNQNYNQPPQNPVVANDTGGFGWGLLGFCVPIAGLILFIVWKDTQPKNAKAAGLGALIMAIHILYFLLFMLLF